MNVEYAISKVVLHFLLCILTYADNDNLLLIIPIQKDLNPSYCHCLYLVTSHTSIFLCEFLLKSVYVPPAILMYSFVTSYFTKLLFLRTFFLHKTDLGKYAKSY